MLQVILKLPEGTYSIKDKRRVVQSLKKRIINKFSVSAAEIDLHESLSFAQVGCALVTNSAKHGELVMQKIILMLESEGEIEIYQTEIYSEVF